MEQAEEKKGRASYARLKRAPRKTDQRSVYSQVGEIDKEFLLQCIIERFVAGIIPKWNSEGVFSCEWFFYIVIRFYSSDITFIHTTNFI